MSQTPAASIFDAIKGGGFPAPCFPSAGRPYGYTMRSWNRASCGDLATWTKYVHLHRDLGYNNISFDLAWADVEATRGSYDFSGYDAHLRVIADAGLTLQLKLNSRRMPAWAKANHEALLCGLDGRIVDDKRIAQEPYHGLSDPGMTEALAGFYRAVAAHGRSLPNLFYVSAFACSFESEYHHSIWTDFSPAAQRQFREYLRAAYASLGELNAAWATSYAAWSEVGIAWQPPETMRDDRPDRRYVDFMKYREWSARRFFDAMHEAIKAGDPKAEYGPQVGRIVCQVGMLRGSISAFHWAENCEWIFVDPAPVDDYAWELAVARAGGKKVAVELDGPYMYRNQKLEGQLPSLYANQTRWSYEHGADYVCHANWNETADYRRGLDEGLFARAAEAKQGVPGVPYAADAVYVGKWDSYLRKNLGWTAQPEAVRELAMARFQALRAEGKPVDVVLDDTILQNPGRLKQYARIHVDGARFVARPVWDELRKSGATIVFGAGAQVLRDESGAELR